VGIDRVFLVEPLTVLKRLGSKPKIDLFNLFVQIISSYTESLNPKFLLPVSKAKEFGNAKTNNACIIQTNTIFCCFANLTCSAKDNKAMFGGTNANNRY